MKPKKYLLDTNICVFFLRKKHNISSYIKSVGLENCFISEITVAELLYGAECSSQVEQNLDLVRDFCSNLNVYPISDSLEIFAKEKTKLRKAGKIIDDFDLLIGVTAIRHDCILVTDNLKHLERLPVEIENWIN